MFPGCREGLQCPGICIHSAWPEHYPLVLSTHEVTSGYWVQFWAPSVGMKMINWSEFSRRPPSWQVAGVSALCEEAERPRLVQPEGGTASVGPKSRLNLLFFQFKNITPCLTTPLPDKESLVGPF